MNKKQLNEVQAEVVELLKGWDYQEHPIWGKGGIEEGVHAIIKRKNVLPTKIWRKGECSIIPPCEVTFGQYELYSPKIDGETERFGTLQEAMIKGNELCEK